MLRKWIYIPVLVVVAMLSMTGCQQRRPTDDQGRTSGCWVYAMLTCIEHEAARRHDSVQLSREWLLAKELQEETERAYFYAHDTPKGYDNRITLRGVGPEVLRLIEKYGMVPYQNEKTQINNGRVLERKLSLLAQQAMSIEELRERMQDLLPRFTLSRSEAFYYLSMRYNPHQFAQSIMYWQNWEFLTSVPYHPYGERMALEVPDNYRHHEYLNVPVDTLVARVLASLRAGHAVYWEYGRRTKDGLVSSDHAMAIVAINGNKLVCQNSYGKKWGKGGKCLVNLKEFRERTCNVGILNNKK